MSSSFRYVLPHNAISSRRPMTSAFNDQEAYHHCRRHRQRPGGAKGGWRLVRVLASRVARACEPGGKGKLFFLYGVCYHD
jgi:hypothetical protein